VQFREGGKLCCLEDWGGKLVGKTMRIAALLHCASVAEPKEVPLQAETVTAAIEIAECLTEHALKAYAINGISETEQNARYLLARLHESGKHEYSKREVLQMVKNKLTAETVAAPLKKLEQHGYIQRIKEQSGQAGRPSETICVHPKAYG